MTTLLGTRVGNYQIAQRLGEGGMATVYLAEHPELGRRVAIKVLRSDLAHSKVMIQRFFTEARAANGVGHRGIVEVFDVGMLSSGAPYIVMELLDGESLTSRLARPGRLAPGEAVEIARQVAAAVGAAHAKGIIHRDLKPDNLYLTRDPLLPGQALVKILDFGIAKLAQGPWAGGERHTRTGTILGTPRYMSPEQCRESRDVDHRTDVYSLGVVLYEMLSGAPPFESHSWGELAHMHIGVEPPALQARAPNVPDGLARVVRRALEKDPAARFQSMAELEEALAAAADGRTLVLPEPAPAPSWAAGSTMVLEDGPPEPAARRTTLAGTASEVVSERDRSPWASPLMPWLVVGAAALAVLVTVGALVAHRSPAPAPPSRAQTVASPVRVLQPAPAPAPAPEPAPSVEAQATEAEAPADIAPLAAHPDAGVAPEPPPPPARTEPAHRRRGPAKPAAPAQAPHPPEPLKI